MRNRPGLRPMTTLRGVATHRNLWVVIALVLVAGPSGINGPASAADATAPVPQTQPPPAAGRQPAPSHRDAPPMREDLPDAKSPEAEQDAQPPYRGGCPYRDRSLELIV